MQQHDEEIRNLGGEVVVVSFADAHRLAEYQQRYASAFPLVADPGLVVYHALELGRASWRKMLGFGVIAKYVRLIFRGWLPEKPADSQDVRQLGGDVVLDAQRRLVYLYRSSDPTDRPAAQELLEAVRRATSGG